ncbi:MULTISPECIES: segregation and condensation protein A [unclassified Psychrobacter]|uniref:segregation and condensation protein A n=1 Tax=unclassified Psychrobacter TaxID=196806 RepID=UPI00071E822E|nr:MULTISPECIES: segregation/condensation protein A [unclassified Psychrobacter]OLF36475.1 segregation/condensation protein A [Psychrobacter sp. Cmf 22.2]
MSLRIYQTPVQHLPEDLYVPPGAFAIWLEQFAGPLDFLLYLVKKNNVDLTQMPILPITEQYLAYISELDTDHFELAGDYLLMASTLIAIKTELLLPSSETPSDERDPKAELIERLEEYAQIKAASERLDTLIRLERDVFLAMVSMPNQDVMTAELPSYSPNLLIDSLFKMQLQPDYQMHSIKVDAVPLSDRIASISRQLSTDADGTHSFYELLDKAQGKIGIVVSFVAVLELIKRQLVGVVSADLTDEATINNELASPIEPIKLQWLA